MIEIKSDVNEKGIGEMSLGMQGNGFELLADACAIVRRLADAFEKRGGPIVRTIFVEAIQDPEFWKLNIDVDGADKIEEVANE